MSQTGKPNEKAGPDRPSGLDVDALANAVEEVVSTLDVTVRAAEFVQARSTDPAERARAADIRRQAAAMLDAVRARSARPRRASRPGDQRTIH